jgi:predicted amidohydrolase
MARLGAAGIGHDGRMRVSILVGQVAAVWDVATNVATIREVIGQARAGDVVVLPEGLLSGYGEDLSPLDSLDPAEVEDAIGQVEGFARQSGVNVFCGSLVPEDGAWVNAGLFFAAGGGHQIYRKINLAMNERGPLRPGDRLPTFEVAGHVPGRDSAAGASAGGGSATGRSRAGGSRTDDARAGGLRAGEATAADVRTGGLRAGDAGMGDGGGFTVGMQLCREIRFPEQWQHLAAVGAELLVYLTNAANPNEPAGVWRSHLISRAAENQRFLACANIADPAQHCPSMVISPRGEVLAELPTGAPGLLRHTVDLSENSGWYLGQRRHDVLSLNYHAG